MAKFSLSNVNSTAVTRLQPWTINEVAYRGIEVKSGKTKDGKEWKALQFKFSGDAGVFEPMIFCPQEGGDERMTGTSNGKEWQLPSALEQLIFTISHVVGVLAPANLEKLKTVEFDLPKDFDKLCELIRKSLKSSENKTTKIKLVGDSKGYATLPQFININKDGDAYISNNWLGDNLAFTPYEITRKEKQAKAKPTEMNESPELDPDSSSDNSDLDFEI